MSEVVFIVSAVISGIGIALGAIGMYRVNRAFKRAAKLENEE